jgi:hypothetical protein
VRRAVALALFAAAGLGAAPALAETPRSPYRVFWSFPGDELSSIDVDRGNLSASRFTSDFQLVKYLGSLKQEKAGKGKAQKGPPGAEAAVQSRELRVEQVDSQGAVRSTKRYAATLETWRQRLGEPMVERLEDEFDAHLRMILPRNPNPAESSE